MAKKDKKKKKKEKALDKKAPQKKVKDKKIKKQKKNKETKTSAQRVDTNAVFITLRQLMDLVADLEVAPLEYGDICIYSAEVNALSKIKDKPEYNLTQLAESLNISKSALLKTTNKLTHKDLIKKTKSPQSRQVTFSLTEVGEKIAEIAPEWRTRAQKPIVDALEDMDDKELAYFNDALERIRINLENVENAVVVE